MNRALCVLAASWLLAACGNRDDVKPDPTTSISDGPEYSVNVGQRDDSVRLFVSGHSLVDQPLPDFLAGIAASMGSSLEWNRQYMPGSPLKRRTITDELANRWGGYRQGLNRDGEGMDVIAEFLRPRTIKGGAYNALLITEHHGILESIVRNDTLRLLRHYHDQFVAGNPRGVTYLYESWIGLDSKDDPRRWIAYERAMARVWQCVATTVNMALQREGRSDRIISLPAASALAHLVELLTTEPSVAAILAPSGLDVVGHIVNDNVHLTRLGSYYISLVVYSSLFGNSSVGAWAPEDVTREQAHALQRIASDFVSSYYRSYSPAAPDHCREWLMREGIHLYWSYIRDAYWVHATNLPRAYVRWLRRILEWRYVFSRDDDRNPFHGDHARGYWLR